MQVFRLINGGFVDRLIAFKSLPKDLLEGVRTRDAAGLPRYWSAWLVEKGSVRPKFKTETEMLQDRTLKITKTPNGFEPCFWVLDYKDLNPEKDKWQLISDHVRRVVDPKTRLMDRLEDMALPMSKDPYSQIELEPDTIPVIEIPGSEESEPAQLAPKEQFMTLQGTVMAETPVKRGRPKKTVEA